MMFFYSSICISYPGHSFSLAYLRQSRCPFSPAFLVVVLFHSHPLSCAYLKENNSPFLAALSQLSECLFSKSSLSSSFLSFLSFLLDDKIKTKHLYH